MSNCKTKQDAYVRISNAVTGSTVGATEEYLLALRSHKKEEEV